MQAADAGAGCAAGGADGQGGAGVPGSRRGGADPAATAAGGAPHVSRASHDPGSGGDVVPAARVPEIRLHMFSLSVPFPTPLEAEIARGSLAPDAEPHQGAVGKELTVSGSTLAICWRAEDSRLLRISIINFLEHLSLVVRTMQRFGPPVSR
ncbi:PREDICTED: EKC/KEOPS complex subunit LAGE3 [Galeopterus variegatus]|uniref:EKC/KEOPS complex subunit LAGE3 n=1 Tax=Galeopterus variegatus TaxID=482537 RepID=A0ABM0S2R4_GALVR|nr:PREDICTED: EKC/KEOPS complex subunit LAGE3 [Galeopterus variegatus]